MKHNDLWDDTIYADIVGMLCGEALGSGACRTVYAHAGDGSCVVKVERPGTFQNPAEWDVWCYLEKTPLGKWLAPCTRISTRGSVLIQKRTQPVRLDELPDKVPALFGDTKVRNWGVYEGRVVCHDYGIITALTKLNALSRMVTANWWEDRYGFPDKKACYGER